MEASPGANSSTPIGRALNLIEKIHKLGFPNADNIEKLTEEIGELAALSLHLPPADQIAVKNLMKTIHKIKQILQEDGDIPARMYNTLHKHLTLIKTSLRNTHKS